MEKWQEFDDYIIYNEAEKIAIKWTTYGDNDEYFLSRKYSFDNDFLDENEEMTFTLINEEITIDNTLESLIKRTKDMA